MDTFAEVRQSDVMNLAEEMEHVETLDQKFLQKIFDRIDVDKKGGCEFQMLHPCFCTEKMVKTENKKTYSPGLQLPQFSGILAINYTFPGGLTSFFYAGLLTLDDIMAGARTDAEFQSRLRVMGSVVLRCTGRAFGAQGSRDPVFRAILSFFLDGSPIV